MLHLLCKNFVQVCRFVINSLVETKTTNHMDYQQIMNLFYYEPGGTSTKNLMHWIQFVRDGKLRQFDYGKTLNIVHYNSPEPPEYNMEELKNFNFHAFFIAGECDIFTDIKDFEFFKNLVNKENKQFKYLPNYNHLDYIWGKDSVEDIYLDVIDFIKNK